jgi:tight adherence protein B
LVIGLLPVGVAMALSVVNPTYMATLWTEPEGRKLLWVALGLQVVGTVLLARMTRLRE